MPSLKLQGQCRAKVRRGTSHDGVLIRLRERYAQYVIVRNFCHRHMQLRPSFHQRPALPAAAPFATGSRCSALHSTSFTVVINAELHFHHLGRTLVVHPACTAAVWVTEVSVRLVATPLSTTGRKSLRRLVSEQLFEYVDKM